MGGKKKLQERRGAAGMGGIAGGSGQGDELSLHVANVARVFVQMPELQCFVHVGGLQPGSGGDGLAGARSPGSASGRSLHARPEVFQFSTTPTGAVTLEVEL